MESRIMIGIRRAVLLLATSGLLTACQDSPTGLRRSEEAAPRLLIVPDPTLVTFNSASCTLTSASAGFVACSWNISNPAETLLNLNVQAILTASYDCVNPHNGRIASSELRDLSTLVQQFSVSSATLTGTDVSLPPTFLPTENTGKFKKENACKGNQVVQNLSYSIAYWSVSVITVGGTLRQSCFASDNRDGCFTS
jgi:hypothetical protein